MRRRTQQEGYSIVVIAALFVAFMVVAASLLEGNVISEQVTRQQAVRTQLGALEKAIIQYAALSNGRYPCPAQYNVAYTNSNFGVQVTQIAPTPATDCVTAATSGMDYIPSGVATADDNVRGMVPVQALVPYGITLDDAFDPWGNRIMYVVNKQLTGAGSGTPTTRPGLTETITSQSFMAPDFLLISYGPDHMGAILKSQTSSFTPTNTCTGATNSARDCSATLSFLRGPLFTGTSATASTYFDDTVVAYADGEDCPAAPVTWTVGGVTCSMTPVRGFPNGATMSVVNTAAGNKGTVTLSCNNGATVQSELHCAVYNAGTTPCTWVAYNDIWPNTASACPSTPSPGTPPYYNLYTACGADAVAGTSELYSTAAGLYPTPQAATCRAGCSYDASSRISTASMMQCRP